MIPAKILFVIPALNEAHNIGNTIRSIHAVASLASLSNYKVQLVDHGSTDNTAEVASNLGANVTRVSGGTIANLRNVGASQEDGDILVFLDADVTLTEQWAQNIASAIGDILAGKKIITGSHCSPPDSNNVLLKHWFSSFANDPRNTHVGTGHMILSKSDFHTIGGFDSSLKTGEDYEFCERAVSKGFHIINSPSLKVLHHDFPKSIGSFIKREAWHGIGDLASIKKATQSKVVVASTVFLAIHALLVIAAISGNRTLVAILILLLAALLLLSSYMKNSHSSGRTILINAGVFYPYYVGRSIALAKRILNIQ